MHRGSEGEDWKWRNVFGRVMLGVGGIPILGTVLLAGVLIESPRASFRRGGVGGFTKEGEDGSDDSMGSWAAGAGTGADITALPRL